MTVKGPLPEGKMGITLTHEHVLVDFIGADQIIEERWDRTKVISKVLPYLLEAKDLGCRTFVDCTHELQPRYLPYLRRNLINILLKALYYVTFTHRRTSSYHKITH